jgi:hypothetical protein
LTSAREGARALATEPPKHPDGRSRADTKTLLPADPILTQIEQGDWEQVDPRKLKRLLRELQRDAFENLAPDQEFEKGSAPRNYRHASEVADVFERLRLAILCGRGRPKKIGSEAVGAFFDFGDPPRVLRRWTRAEMQRRADLATALLVRRAKARKGDDIVAEVVTELRLLLPKKTKIDAILLRKRSLDLLQRFHWVKWNSSDRYLRRKLKLNRAQLPKGSQSWNPFKSIDAEVRERMKGIDTTVTKK